MAFVSTVIYTIPDPCSTQTKLGKKIYSIIIEPPKIKYYFIMAKKIVDITQICNAYVKYDLNKCLLKKHLRRV